MGFLNKISGLFGLGKDDPHPHPPPAAAAEVPANFHHRPTKGFSVQVSVPSEKPQLGPVIVPCVPGQGGVQGLNWYKHAMKIDEDGDVADEFLEEISQDTAALDNQNQRITRCFVVRAPSAPIVVIDQVVVDGMVKQQVECNGMLQWV